MYEENIHIITLCTIGFKCAAGNTFSRRGDVENCRKLRGKNHFCKKYNELYIKKLK